MNRPTHRVASIILGVVTIGSVFGLGCSSGKDTEVERLQKENKLLKDQLAQRDGASEHSTHRPSSGKVDTNVDVKSQNIKEQQEKFLRRWGLENAVVEVKLLQIRQRFSTAIATFEITNKSAARITFWDIDMAIYDSGGKFLGEGFSFGTFLKAGDSVIEEFDCEDVDSAKIESWKLRLGDGLRIENENGEKLRAISYFKLKEVKNNTD